MCIIDVVMAMARISNSDPQGVSKVFPKQVRLRIDKSFIWSQCESWQCVQKLAIEGSSSWMLPARNRSPTETLYWSAFLCPPHALCVSKKLSWKEIS